MQRRTPALILAAALAVGALGACSSDGSDGSAADPDPTDAPAATTTTDAPAEDEPLQILVTNDDGYEGEGIAALVDGLNTLPNVVVTVVAPLEDQTGQGGATTEGELGVTEVEMTNGYAAQAVDGYPADTIRAAVDQLDLEPHLVISGINEGQNLGPALDKSGTVGAARAAVAHGIPSLATSQGFGEEIDYEAAIPFITEWVEDNRADLLSGDAAVAVTNLNVPSCDEGEIKGLAEVNPNMDGDLAESLKPQDCTGPKAESDPANDVEGFLDGYAVIGLIPATPRS